MVADNGIMSSPPFRTSKQSYLLRDRNLIGKGPFGLSIAATCLTIAILASVLYGIIWALEGSVLYEIFGMSMPLVAKISSLLSTLFLFTVLFKSTAMVYILIGSCVMYTMLHVTLLSTVIFFYMEYIKETDVLFRLMYYERSTIYFVSFISVSIIRLIITFPLLYYSLILAAIRINGGSGWEGKTALELEKSALDKQLMELQNRKEWVNTLSTPEDN